ncbi:MAG: GntR family transcriptional regulator [Chloroflexi bacterium]|nr:GntR family transcriptional regulator [Chloroflexota bacterium]
MATETDSTFPDLTPLLPHAVAYTTKQDFVASLLREAIVSGKIPPGRRLRQEEISRQLGLSWTPVREAFRQLEVEGWLVIERHRGAIVSPLSLADFEDIYLLRLANEPVAARLSAERVDGETLAAMERLYEQMRQLDLTRTADWLTFLQLEREFLATQYRAAGRPRLYDLVMGLRDAAERYLRASFAITDEPSQHHLTHTELIVACRERNGAAAAATMQRALERVLARMSPLLAGVLSGSGRGE